METLASSSMQTRSRLRAQLNRLLHETSIGRSLITVESRELHRVVARKHGDNIHHKHQNARQHTIQWQTMIMTDERRLLLGIKDQRPNFNGLPLGGIRRTRVVKESRMGGQACLVDVGVEALDKGNFVWCLVGQVIPFVSGIVPDAKGGTLAISINVTGWNEVCIGIDGTIVRYGKRFVCHGVGNGSRKRMSGYLVRRGYGTYLQTLMMRYRPLRSLSASSPR